MIRLTYISTAKRGIESAEIDAILAVSRHRNRADGITGLLLYDGVRFLQALEGEPGVVADAYARIKMDPRHRACVQLDSGVIAARAFGEWGMAWQRVDRVGAGETLAERVDAIVGQVADPSTRALFSSFARIDRPAA